MKKSIFFIILFLFCSSIGFSQDRTIDSLLQTRKTDSLAGKVKTFYSPGSKKIATELQQLVSDAVAYYENKYAIKFEIKMIVLDSTQWFKEILPFGFVFYDNTHWLVLNAGMDYDTFKKVYGFKAIAPQLDSAMEKNHFTSKEIIYARLKFLSLHELGHYFVIALSNAKSPNFWTNEFVAWYFANEYMTQFRPELKKQFDLFCKTIANSYHPDYTSLKDFNEIYGKMQKGNFAWYHSRFYFLTDALYQCSGTSYLKTYESKFPKSDTTKLTTLQVNKLVEADCNGIIAKWIEVTESNRKVH
jgi:hypothetical protein